MPLNNTPITRGLLHNFFKELNEGSSGEYDNFELISTTSRFFMYRYEVHGVSEDDLFKLIEDAEIYFSNIEVGEPDYGTLERKILAFTEDYFIIANNYETEVPKYDGINVFRSVQLFSNKMIDFAELVKPLKSNNAETKILIMTLNPKGELSNFWTKPKYQPIDFDKHYNDSIREIDAEVDSFIKADQSGIILLHGQTGTGKTNYVLSLTDRYKDHLFVFVDNKAAMVYNPMTEISRIDKKKLIFVFEDAEQLIRKSSVGRHPAVAFTLSMIDGPFGKYNNVKYIFTTNLGEQDIDDAIRRPGRMRGIFNFGLLDAAKVHAINPDYNEDMTLAQLYNTIYDKEAVKRIGF